MLGPDGKPLPVVIDDNIGRFVQGGKYQEPFTVGNYVIQYLLRNISQKFPFVLNLLSQCVVDRIEIEFFLKNVT